MTAAFHVGFTLGVPWALAQRVNGSDSTIVEIDKALTNFAPLMRVQCTLNEPL